MKKKIINALFVMSFVFYILFLLWNILFKYISPLDLFSSTREFYRSVNLVPFNDIINGIYNQLDVWGNVILFIPLGIYINMFFKDSKKIKDIVKLAGISLFFEISQYVFAIGATDITDIITNTLGGAIGICIYLFLKKVLKEDNKVKNLVVIFSTIVMMIVTIIILLLLINN